MTNRIRQVEVRDRLRDPTEPEIWVGVVPERASARVDIRGRLMGPQCRYASTVEVAYSLRISSAPVPETLPGIPRRVFIPEAGFWDPTSPFLYRGPIELWEDDALCDQTTLSHGLRAFGLGSKGLRLNGRSIVLRGLVRNECPEAEMLQLRRDGFNTLLADVTASAASLWDRADEIGFLVLGRVSASSAAIAQALPRRAHASNLGWVLDAAILADPNLRAAAAPLLARTAGELLGIEVGAVPPASLAEAQFLLGTHSALAAVPPGLPRILLDSDDRASSPGLLGTIRP